MATQGGWIVEVTSAVLRRAGSCSLAALLRRRYVTACCTPCDNGSTRGSGRWQVTVPEAGSRRAGSSPPCSPTCTALCAGVWFAEEVQPRCRDVVPHSLCGRLRHGFHLRSRCTAGVDVLRSVSAGTVWRSTRTRRDWWPFGSCGVQAGRLPSGTSRRTFDCWGSPITGGRSRRASWVVTPHGCHPGFQRALRRICRDWCRCNRHRRLRNSTHLGEKRAGTLRTTDHGQRRSVAPVRDGVQRLWRNGVSAQAGASRLRGTTSLACAAVSLPAAVWSLGVPARSANR